MNVFTPTYGWVIISVYSALTIMITYLYRYRSDKTKLNFLVANRQVSKWPAAFSIAATWIWAPALFVAAQKAYTHGWVGLFWFTVPNVAVLVIFGHFAASMRRQLPEGWTFTDHIREKFSNRVHTLFLVESFGLQTMSFAVQLLAGGMIINTMTGIPFHLIIITLAAVPLLYALWNGVKASIMTDFWQMVWIVAVLFLGVPLLLNSAGWQTITAGLAGVNSNYRSLFDAGGWEVFITFGLPGTIGLLSGPFGDQMFWQRVWSIREKDLKSAFKWSAIIFAVVPLGMSLLGFAVAGAGMQIDNVQLANLEGVMAFLPGWFLVLFAFMILSGLISTVDSVMCATSSIVGHDLIKRAKLSGNPVAISRQAMVILAVVAISIAMIPGVEIVYLWLVYGTLRASVLLPTMLAIKNVKMSERGLFYGVLVSILIGLPLFAVGKFLGHNWVIVTGSLLTVLASGVLATTIKSKRK